MAVEYKFKPYAPTKLKKKKVAGVDDVEKSIKSLEKQRENLNKRLLAEGIDPATLGGEFDNRNIIEKALNLKPDQGLLMNFIDIIDRPVQAVKQGLMAGKKGNSSLEGFAKGLAGTGEEISGSDFLKEYLGIELQGTGLGKFGLDVAADIIFDPLTYLPAGIIAKGLSKLGKIGSKTITVTGADVAAKLATKIDDAVRGAKAGVAKYKNSIMTIDQIESLATSKAVKGSGAESMALTEIDKLLKATGLGELSKKFKIIDKGMLVEGTEQGLRKSKDLSVMFEFNKGEFVEVSKIEVKDLLSFNKNKGQLLRGEAFGITSALSLQDLKNVDGINSNIKRNFLQMTEGVTVAVDGAKPVPMKEWMEAKIRGKKVGQNTLTSTSKRKLSVVVSDPEKVQAALKQVFLDDLADAGVDFVTFRYGTNEAPKLVTLSRDTLSKHLGVRATFGVKSTNATMSSKLVKGLGGQVADAVGNFKAEIKNAFKNYKTVRNSTITKGMREAAEKAGYSLANSDVIIELPNAIKQEEVLAQLTKKQFTFKNDKGALEAVVGVSSGAAIEVGDDTTKYVFKSSKKSAAKKSQDLVSTIDLVDSSGNRLTDDAIEALDESLAFQESLVVPGQKGTTTTTQTITLAGRARLGEFDNISPLIKKVAVAYKSFETKFKLTFNLTAGFDKKTKALLMRAQGADMFDLERRSGVLAEIKQRLIKENPEAGELLGEIIEADARVNSSGVIEKLKREMGTSDFFDYVYNMVAKNEGDRIIIPAFADDAAKATFVGNLNDIYRKATGATDDIFSVAVGEAGGTVVRFAGDKSEMLDLVQYIRGTSTELPTHLKFGEKRLSQKAKAFLRNNMDQIEKYKDLSSEILDDLINVAGFKNMPQQLQNQIGYMRHAMSKEAMDGLRKQMPGALSIYAKPGKNTLGQRIIPGSVQEINAAMRDFFGATTDFFDPNAFNAMEDLIKQTARKMDQKQVLDIILSNKGVDGTDLFKVVDNTQEMKAAMSPYDIMIKDFKEDFNSLFQNLSPEAQKTFEEFLTKNGYGKGKAIQLNRSAYNVLKGVEKAYFDVPQLAKIYDKFLTMWKGLTLITPGFHMRNLFGNMFNSYAVGMDVLAQSKYLGTAMQELNTFQDIGKKLAQGLDITAGERKIYDTVRGYFEQGVSQTHRGIRDLESVMEASAKEVKKGTLKNTYNNVVRFNFNVAERMDDVQRYALYRWGLDTTGDATKAANTVAEALFDYSHLTPFEKSYMKRLFPFYTFMKNNFVFQMKNIFKNPKQYARLARAYKYASEDLAGYNLDDLPDYAVENMWLPLPWTVDKNDKEAVAFLKATLPLSDFTELVENPFKKGVTSITAPIKLIIEFGAGKDLFTGQPLEAFPGQTSAMPEGTGVLSGLRDRRGNLTITQSPLFIKIMNDLGLRAPINIASAGLDVVDTLAGYQGNVESLGDFLQRAGIAGVSEMDRLKLSRLYQDLEKLRELKKFYEQETGNQLPVLPRG